MCAFFSFRKQIYLLAIDLFFVPCESGSGRERRGRRRTSCPIVGGEEVDEATPRTCEIRRREGRHTGGPKPQGIHDL